MRGGRVTSSRAGVALVVGLLGALCQAAPAGATYPGQNTDLFVVESSSGQSGSSATGLARYDESGAFGGGAPAAATPGRA